MNEFALLQPIARATCRRQAERKMTSVCRQTSATLPAWSLLSDLRYAFVVDSSLPVGFSEEFMGYPSQATRFEDFHDLGSKVGVIKDVFTQSGI